MKFFFKPNHNFRLFWIFIYIVVDSAIAKNSKFTFFIVHEFSSLFETLHLLKLPKFIFQIFLPDLLHIYPLPKDHRHSFSFWIIEALLKDFVLGEVWVLDELAEGFAFDCYAWIYLVNKKVLSSLLKN